MSYGVLVGKVKGLTLMGQLTFRAAVSPLRRRFPDKRAKNLSVASLVAKERPEIPLHCLRPKVVAGAAERFVHAFPGDVLYAVKCNPDPRILRALWRGGIRHFDCASPAEVSLVRQMFPAAFIHFMHPIKSRPAIREAFFNYGVSSFALDSRPELEKILNTTQASSAKQRRPRLDLFVRLSVGKTGAVHDLSGKFGASISETAELLAAARPFAVRLGVCFHVGSQCTDPHAYRLALQIAQDAIARSGVRVDIIDVGGGFPATYVNSSPPPLDAFFAAIKAEMALGDQLSNTTLWAEPGRALVADGVSLVVQVLARKGDDLYINDGVFGSLFDAGRPDLHFPARLICAENREPTSTLRAYRFFGPTCDSLDRMDGPFYLPDDVCEGDWIEIGQIGAYGSALRTAFNGFDRARVVEVNSPPFFRSQLRPTA